MIQLYIKDDCKIEKIEIDKLLLKKNDSIFIDYVRDFWDCEFYTKIPSCIKQYYPFLDEYARSSLRIIKNVENVPELSIMDIMVRFRWNFYKLVGYIY